MFLDFFLLLKKQDLPVSLLEYLSLLEGLKRGLANQSVDDFYVLCRCTLIKREQHLDRFDQLFGAYFKGLEQIPDATIYDIPADWLKKDGHRIFSEEEMAKIKAMGGLDALLKRIEELFQEQNERHQGGNKWIGTGGTSPFGAYGYNPEGIRIGQHESRHRKAVKVWDKRLFKNLDEHEALDARNLKLALKQLRKLTRVGLEEELDLPKTIKNTSNKAGLLDLTFVPQKKNNVKVLLLLDIGGSMDDHIERCSQLFAAAKYEFKHLAFYYFHNCIYETVWQDNARRRETAISTYDLLHRYNSDYQVIFVGDAAMAPYELTMQYGSVEHYNEEAGLVWLERIKAQFPNMVWLNPADPADWEWTHSTQLIKQFMDNRMYPLTIEGIGKAIDNLKGKNRTVS